MAELNELIEYLYEESAAEKQHGLGEIILNLRCRTEFHPQSLLYLQRILLRLHSECSKGEEILPLILISLNLLTYRTNSLSIWSQSYPCSTDNSTFKFLAGESQEISNPCFHLRLISAILFKQVNTLRSIIPALLRATSFQASFAPAFMMSSKLLAYLSCVEECHVDLYGNDAVACLESRVNANDESPWCLVALYNLSFKVEFLRGYSWELYWERCSDPSSARILIHGIYSGLCLISADDLHTKATTLLTNMIDGKGPLIETRVLYRYLILRVDFDRVHFTVKNRLLLFELLHTGITQDNGFLLRVLLYTPNDWVKDRVYLILDIVSRQALLKEGTVYVIIKLIWKHVPMETCLTTFPILTAWSSHHYAGEAFKTENGSMIERFFLACKILGIKEFYEKILFQIQRFKNKDLQKRIADELLEKSDSFTFTDEDLGTLLGLASRISHRVSAQLITGKSDNPRLIELIKNLQH